MSAARKNLKRIVPRLFPLLHYKALCRTCDTAMGNDPEIIRIAAL